MFGRLILQESIYIETKYAFKSCFYVFGPYIPLQGLGQVSFNEDLPRLPRMSTIGALMPAARQRGSSSQV